MVSETLAVRGPSRVATIFKLIIEDDEGKTTVYPLSDGDISIGRKDGNTIRLMERNVSRRHARLVRSNGAVFIEDLDSYNGIRINGERISGRYEVKEGDLVEIGDYHLALQRQEIEDAAEDAPQKPDGWPAVGTVPDFRLPDEILADGPPPDPQVSTRDTIVDQPAPPDLPTAIAATIPAESTHVISHKESAKHGPQLPPFPTPQSPPPARVPFFSGAAAPAAKDGEGKSLSVGPSRVAAVPRLICVSTNYAGREFALTRPELIIGRVEDNDIVIEHRSVSRNHAKILYDGRTHKIIDLQSANGILVNGEEYAMTDLRKGDLIELGHVRFRFVPAGEDFAPSDEESREMREAGVEPPPPPGRDGAPMKAVDVPSDVSGYDPSTAATVTDTPLSALNMNEVFAPKVEVTKPNQAPRRRDSHAPKNGAAPKRATEDERPTEINHVSSRSPTAASPTAPMGAAPVSDAMELEFTKPQAALSLSDDSPRRERSSLPLILAGVVACGVVAAVAFTLLSGVDDSNDQILYRLYQEKKWEEANKFCEGKPTFANEAESWQRCFEAKTNAAPQSKKIEPTPPPEVADVAGDEPPEGEGEGEGEVAEADPVEEGTPERPRRPKPPPKKVTAKKPEPGPTVLAQNAYKALAVGRLGDAKDMLIDCVTRFPKAADCHRSLGSIYANLDDTAQSIFHYKRYLALRPNAADAARVKKMIRDVEGETPP